MKKLLILLSILACSFSAFAQGPNSFGGVALRVNDTTTYQSNAAAFHTAGYYDIYFNNQATNDHWDVWNGSSYDHIFAFNSIPAAYVTDDVSTSTAGGTITLDMNNQNIRGFYGSAAFSGPKTIAMSNVGSKGIFTLSLVIEDDAGVLTLPSDWKMSDIRWDGSTWTPPATATTGTEFIFGGKLINGTWKVNVAGPYTQ